MRSPSLSPAPRPPAGTGVAADIGSGGGGSGGGGGGARGDHDGGRHGLPSPTAGAALADVDLIGRLSAHWDVKFALERLTQLENDEVLARRLQEQVWCFL